jgi:predicted TIM-barrel fold metal-dependent hydrolase
MTPAVGHVRILLTLAMTLVSAATVVGWMPLLLEAFRGVGTSKILFGSDHPYNPLPMEVEKISKHVSKAAKLTQDDLKKVFAANLLAILKHDR